MSSATSDSRPSLVRDRLSAGAVTAVCRNVTLRGVRALAFWSAIVLPIAILAVLSGGVGGQQVSLLSGLLALNVLCLLVGNEHAT